MLKIVIFSVKVLTMSLCQTDIFARLHPLRDLLLYVVSVHLLRQDISREPLKNNLVLVQFQIPNFDSFFFRKDNEPVT